MKKKKIYTFENEAVAEIFSQMSNLTRERLLEIRELLYEISEKNPSIGKIQETLKWNEPSYITEETRSGTTIRLNQIKKNPDFIGIFVNCQTTIVDEFRKIHKNKFQYDKNRGLILSVKKSLPIKNLELFLTLALTYHIRKKSRT